MASMQSEIFLKVNVECMNARENRVGIDQVKDRVDKNLVKENDNIRKYQQQMKVWVGVLEEQVTVQV